MHLCLEGEKNSKKKKELLFKLMGKKNVIICFTSFSIMSFNNCKLWSMDVKSWTWYFCIGDF
jgi:hypothetical protein